MAFLAGVWNEMLWPLDEGSALPLCVRTVTRGRHMEDVEDLAALCRPAACMCVLCGGACVGEAVLVEWAA
jgi:hypothetical protein